MKEVKKEKGEEFFSFSSFITFVCLCSTRFSVSSLCAEAYLMTLVRKFEITLGKYLLAEILY
jgi:hypothetical protein